MVKNKQYGKKELKDLIDQINTRRSITRHHLLIGLYCCELYAKGVRSDDIELEKVE